MGHSAFQKRKREYPGWEVSRALLVGIVGVEPITLVVLDAPKRRGIRLVQDNAQDLIHERRRVRKTLKDQPLTCFSPLNDEDEAVAVPRDHLVVNDRSHRRCLDDYQVIRLARNLD